MTLHIKVILEVKYMTEVNIITAVFLFFFFYQTPVGLAVAVGLVSKDETLQVEINCFEPNHIIS